MNDNIKVSTAAFAKLWNENESAQAEKWFRDGGVIRGQRVLVLSAGNYVADPPKFEPESALDPQVLACMRQ